MHVFDQNNASCHVLTFKDGVLSAVAHDLRLTVGRWSLSWDGERLEGRFATDSLTVDCAMRSGKAAPGTIASRDKAKIVKNLQKDVLNVRRHPEVVFKSTQVQATDAGGFTVSGDLTLAGCTRPIRAEVSPAGDRLEARFRLNQVDFGIKPFSAMFGTLKVQPTVEIVVNTARLGTGEA